MPLEVLESARDELTDWLGSGMSVMEVSHRGKDFVACAAETERLLRELVGVPDDYRVLFLQGGETGQFAALPYNFTAPGDTVDFLATGQWSAKAIKEAKKFGVQANVVADTGPDYVKVPEEGSFTTTPGARYLHYTANETIGGLTYPYVPEADIPVVTDMSSMMLSQPVDVAKFGAITAGTQKNMGPAGLAVVIVRDDLIGHARPDTPSIWDYKLMADADSMLNTPPTFGIYLLGKILAWVQSRGGLAGMAKRNEEKASALYSFIDGSGYYSNPVEPGSRSRMNVPFLQANPELDKQFVAEAASAGLTNLAGHRSVGGMRASIYNAMSLDGVNALIEFMKEFERTHG